LGQWKRSILYDLREGDHTMSNESFKAFMTKVAADPGLREQLRAAGGEAGLSSQALADFAKGQGYAFTAEDVTGELSDKDLEGVAGGILIGLNQPTLTDKLSPFSVTRTALDLVFKFY
jgi:predicted ribosomally synthesized peptide with nif11-like leader